MEPVQAVEQSVFSEVMGLSFFPHAQVQVLVDNLADRGHGAS